MSCPWLFSLGFGLFYILESLPSRVSTVITLPGPKQANTCLGPRGGDQDLLASGTIACLWQFPDCTPLARINFAKFFGETSPRLEAT